MSNFRIAVTTKHKSGDGYKDETLFIDVVVFGKQAENCSQYLAKGRKALVEGRLLRPSNPIPVLGVVFPPNRYQF